MVDSMKSVAKMDAELSTEERNLLSVAYKNVIGARRAAWRIVSSMETKAVDEAKSEKHIESMREYKKKIEAELKKICGEIIELLKNLIPRAADAEAKVFFLKMKGDYFRYLAEIETDENKEETCSEAKKCYEDASDTAAQELSQVNPIRLGLSLNFSVFHYELLNDREEACKLAKDAFDKAIAELDTLKEDSYKDSTLIMQLLRDNLTLWTSENDDTRVEEVDDEEK